MRGTAWAGQRTSPRFLTGEPFKPRPYEFGIGLAKLVSKRHGVAFDGGVPLSQHVDQFGSVKLLRTVLNSSKIAMM